mmetsp:Transcript_95808/g.298413  ORF Transcript_95808/g.298413 Transcript_95808/m.298413 type:complete len:218 (-) Transcript_95808:1675-2328(-)
MSSTGSRGDGAALPHIRSGLRVGGHRRTDGADPPHHEREQCHQEEERHRHDAHAPHVRKSVQEQEPDKRHDEAGPERQAKPEELVRGVADTQPHVDPERERLLGELPDVGDLKLLHEGRLRVDLREEVTLQGLVVCFSLCGARRPRQAQGGRGNEPQQLCLPLFLAGRRSCRCVREGGGLLLALPALHLELRPGQELLGATVDHAERQGVIEEDRKE